MERRLSKVGWPPSIFKETTTSAPPESSSLMEALSNSGKETDRLLFTYTRIQETATGEAFIIRPGGRSGRVFFALSLANSPVGIPVPQNERLKDFSSDSLEALFDFCNYGVRQTMERGVQRGPSFLSSSSRDIG